MFTDRVIATVYCCQDLIAGVPEPGLSVHVFLSAACCSTHPLMSMASHIPNNAVPQVGPGQPSNFQHNAYSQHAGPQSFPGLASYDSYQTSSPQQQAGNSERWPPVQHCQPPPTGVPPSYQQYAFPGVQGPPGLQGQHAFTAAHEPLASSTEYESGSEEDSSSDEEEGSEEESSDEEVSSAAVDQPASVKEGYSKPQYHPDHSPAQQAAQELNQHAPQQTSQQPLQRPFQQPIRQPLQQPVEQTHQRPTQQRSPPVDRQLNFNAPQQQLHQLQRPAQHMSQRPAQGSIQRPDRYRSNAESLPERSLNEEQSSAQDASSLSKSPSLDHSVQQWRERVQPMSPAAWLSQCGLSQKDQQYRSRRLYDEDSPRGRVGDAQRSTANKVRRPKAVNIDQFGRRVVVEKRSVHGDGALKCCVM